MNATWVLLMILLGWTTAAATCTDNRTNATSNCVSYGAAALSREAIFRAMDQKNRQEEIDQRAREEAAKAALETRLAVHCADREKRTCQVVERMQQNMMEHTRSDTWWIGGVDRDIGLCAMISLVQLDFTTQYDMDTGKLHVRRHHDGCCPKAGFFDVRGYGRYTLYQEAIFKNHEAITEYFTQLGQVMPSSPTAPSTSSPSLLDRKAPPEFLFSVIFVMFLLCVSIVAKIIK